MSDLMMLRGLWRDHPRYQGCVGHWLMNEGGGLRVDDLSGHGNHGTLINGPTWGTGKLGNALDFDGDNDYVGDADTSNFPSSGTPFSMAVWVKPQTLVGAPRIFLMFGPQTTNQGPHLAVSTDRWRFGVWGGASIDWITPPTTEWHHVAGVFDGTNGYLYVDGALRAGPVATTYTAAGTIPLRAGGATGGFNFLHSLIDDMRIYNRASDATGIMSLVSHPYAEFDWAAEQLSRHVRVVEIQGSVTVTPAAASVSATATSPSVILGDITIANLLASAQAAAIGPVVEQGSVAVTPAVASGTSSAISPTVVLGSVSLTPGDASATASALSPSVALGSVSVTPALAQVSTTAISPVVVLGSVSVAPGVVSATATAINPEVQDGGNVEVSPAVASAQAQAINPVVVQSSMEVTPAVASATASVAIGSILQGSLSLVPAHAAATAAALDPAVVLGSATVSPSVASATATAISPTVLGGVVFPGIDPVRFELRIVQIVPFQLQTGQLVRFELQR